MNEQLLRLIDLALYHDVKLWKRGNNYWVEFEDAYERRTLCSPDVDELMERAVSIAEVSDRSHKRELQRT